MNGQTPPVILLSKYTFSKGRSKVGKIVTVPGAELRLGGNDATAFRIRNNTLISRTVDKRPWYDVVIEARTADKVITDTFRIVNDQFLHNKVIAHRGAWKKAVTAENSIKSLQNAIALGCEGSEFDVHLSADSALWIHHDPDVDGMVIERSATAELSKVRLSNGERLPTLEEYLTEGMRQNQTRLILEIKPTALGEARALEVARHVVQAVRKMKAQAWVDYISFDYSICKEVMRLDPFAHVAYLNGDKSPEQLAADRLSGFDYHFNVLAKNESWIEEARKKHLTTNAWTVNDRETMLRLLKKNIDFITTNEPELLLQLLNQK